MTSTAIGSITRIEVGEIVVTIPGDDIVINIRKAVDSSIDYELGDEVVLLKVPVNRWTIIGRYVDV